MLATQRFFIFLIKFKLALACWHCEDSLRSCQLAKMNLACAKPIHVGNLAKQALSLKELPTFQNAQIGMLAIQVGKLADGSGELITKGNLEIVPR